VRESFWFPFGIVRPEGPLMDSPKHTLRDAQPPSSDPARVVRRRSVLRWSPRTNPGEGIFFISLWDRQAWRTINGLTKTYAPRRPAAKQRHCSSGLAQTCQGRITTFELRWGIILYFPVRSSRLMDHPPNSFLWWFHKGFRHTLRNTRPEDSCPTRGI